MPERFPGYDVLAKRDTPSWNDATRRVMDARLAIVDAPKFLDQHQWLTLRAICDGIVPQSARPQTRVPIAAMVDRKLAKDHRDGYRDARLPPLREAWRRGLAALDVAAQTRAGAPFHLLAAAARDALLKDMHVFARGPQSSLEVDQIAAVRVRWERENRKQRAEEPAKPKPRIIRQPDLLAGE